MKLPEKVTKMTQKVSQTANKAWDSFFSKFLVYEKSRKQKVLLIIRAVIFVALIVLFFATPKLYFKTKKSGTIIYYKRIFGTILIAIACTFLPLLKLKLPKRAVYSIQFCSIAGGCFISLWAGEHVFKYNWTELLLTPIVFNLMILFAIFTFFYLVSNRLKFAVLATYCFTILFAIVNYYVYHFRGEPINAADIYTIGTALNVANEYKIKVTWQIFEVLLCGASMFSILTFLPVEHKRVSGWKMIFYIVPGTALIVLVFYTITVAAYPLNNGIKVKTFRPVKTYKSNGQLLNFFRGFYYMQVPVPEGYSSEAAEQVMEQSGYVSDDATLDDGQVNPNIIFVMNEALTDFTTFDTVELSEDPLKFIHSLKGKDNVILGEVDVDVFGGRTANSEYEAITGNSAAFFTPNAVPYALYVRDPAPSLVWNMRDIGYSGNYAFHPYKANGYSRPRAYPNLGFSEFVSRETIIDTLTEEDYVRSHVSDSRNFKEIIRLYEETRQTSKDPFFLFNVTMQNHGGYDTDFDNFIQDIEVYGAHDGDDEFKRYINLVDYTDEAFEELIRYFENVDEPTIILMFGDHQPNVGNEFFSNAFGKSRGSLNSTEIFLNYRTPLIIWANYDINKDGKYDKQYEHVSVNYLSAVVADIAGLPMTGYQKFLLDMQKEIPTFTAHGYIDKDGNIYDLESTTSPYYETWVKKYQYFEYNYQFDKGKRHDWFFQLKSDNNAMNSAQ
ncbi:MAG: LTA synthase family protein [Lachnospiraceae bacterium]|nr:LTA synthase family protein [Lachnospiraceae bacterium]